MTELKCPFCGHNLGRKNINDRMCSNEKCVSWKGNFYGSEDLWQELIRTRKALDDANEKLKHCVNITVEELDELKSNLLIAWNALLHFSKDPIANNALKKITAPEQRDK